ncbi:MAG: NAD(P)-dependent oxidoreductase [Caldilineaceae bacterium]|nr:NAD(P)-dependent oxidoreductase [Caldilineaceae bacterium]
MKFKTIGIISPGDMGHVVGDVLRAGGLRVVACLDGRSPRTKALAQQAHLEDLGSVEAVVSEADAILSILVPAEAERAATAVATAMQQRGASLLYADCNAISPATTRLIGERIEAAGGRFVDASIIGPPPRRVGATRFYASGPHAGDLAALNDYGLHVIPIGERVGDASALKMCYAALTKGLTALSTELLVAAEALGITEPLQAEFRQSQSSMLAQMERGLPGMPPKARRWVGEMEEIASTFESVGLTPKILLGAADIYRFVGDTTLADRNPEDPGQPSLSDMIAQLAQHLR